MDSDLSLRLSPAAKSYRAKHLDKTVRGLETTLSSELEWTFFGRVLPERVPVTVHIPGIKMGDDTLDLHIHLSQITLSLKTSDFSEDAYTVRNSLDSFVRTILDLIGYDHGMSFDVEIISCTNSLGNWWSFGAEIPVLFQKKQHSSYTVESDTFNLFLTDPSVFIALSDFREAMRMPMQTGFFCYRAAESMMQSVKTTTLEKDGLAWNRLRAALNVDKTALNFIKGHADWARHGKTGEITDSERAQMFLLTDEIIGRYLRYVSGGRVPLSADQTPLLSHPM